MKLNILGCHSATPRTYRNPTAQVLEIKNHLFLIDCGEGTQVLLRRNKIKFAKIKHIFISHLHGDHYFGLIGLISTFHLLGRTGDLHIYGPKGLKEVILLQLKLANSWTKFQLVFHELISADSQMIFEDEQVIVSTIPLVHRIYTNGFLFQEKPGERILDYEAAIRAKIDMVYFRKLKQGFDVKNKQDKLIANDLVTKDPKPTKSYAFCSDTQFSTDLAHYIRGVDVLYHEATFLEQHLHLAEPTKHSTARQAAEIAALAEVGLLILGHFSTRYDNLENFKEEAGQVFAKVLLAEDGKTFNFDEILNTNG